MIPLNLPDKIKVDFLASDQTLEELLEVGQLDALFALYIPAILGKDFWSYGLKPNRPALEAIGQYVYEQGFSPRAVSAEELFALNL